MLLCFHALIAIGSKHFLPKKNWWFDVIIDCATLENQYSVNVPVAEYNNK